MKKKQFLFALLSCLPFLVPAASFSEAFDETILFQEIAPAAGTLVQSKANRSPVSVTTIDEEQLRLTPARNLYDILEVFVPGFEYMTHFDSSDMGMRGLITDRNFGFLLLVDGQVVNQKSHDGAISELENWDLSDIQKVEVIRGPGSVTYGPGAVAGVISITTKNAATAQGTQAGLQYVSGYNSLGAHVSEGIQGKDLSFYISGSVTHTQGEINPSIMAFAPPSIEASYVKDAGSAPVIDYMTDTRDKPQMKFTTELDFLNEWKAWARYVNSGITRITTWTDSPTAQWFFKHVNADGSYEDNPCTAIQQVDLSFENDHVFDKTLDLKTSLMGTSIDNKRVDVGAWAQGSFIENFAETDLTLKSILRYTPLEALKTAVGIEAQYNHLGMGWGETDKDSFIIDDGVDFVSRVDSPAMQARSWQTGIPLTNIDLYSFSFLGEVSYSLTNQFDIMLSARADKGRYTPVAFSPRLSFIYDADTAGTFKLNFQQSVRDNTLVMEAAAAYSGAQQPNQELYKGAEFIYSNSFIKNLLSELSAYYTNADLLGWNNPNTTNAGTLQIAGAELSLDYKNDDKTFRIGGSHTFAKQVGFTLPGDTTKSYVSVSDANYLDNNNSASGVLMRSIGNDRMNWPDNQTKVFTTIKLLDNLTLFSDMRYIWGYEGDQNWLTAETNGAQGTASQAQTDINVAYLRDQGIFGKQFRFDLSLSYEFVKGLTVTLIGQNLIRLTHEWRYVYVQEGGAALDEPTVGGLRVDYKF